MFPSFHSEYLGGFLLYGSALPAKIGLRIPFCDNSQWSWLGSRPEEIWQFEKWENNWLGIETGWKRSLDPGQIRGFNRLTFWRQSMHLKSYRLGGPLSRCLVLNLKIVEIIAPENFKRPYATPQCNSRITLQIFVQKIRVEIPNGRLVAPSSG